MKEIYYKIIDLPSHQVLVVKDFDEEKEENNSLIVIEFFNEGMKLKMSLGYDSEEKRDAMFERADKEMIKGMLEKAVPGINLLELEAEETTDSLTQDQKDIVNEIISNVVLLEDPIKPTDKFNDDLGCDSLDHVEIIMSAEQEFNISIPDDEAEQIVTVQDAYDLLTKLL